MTDYTDMTAKEFGESDHRLAGAFPLHQPEDYDFNCHKDPHRLAGALPAEN